MKTVIVALLVCCISTFSMAKAPANDGSQLQADNLYPKVKLETTMGDIVIELDRYKAPITANNFLRYVDKRSFENTIFHRIVPEFVVQGGGYNTDFIEQPKFGEIFNESGNGNKNDAYTVAMARQSGAHTANRQFFFNLKDNESLNPGRDWGYTVFATVSSGHDVIDAMSEVETKFDAELGWNDVPVEPILLIKATLLPQTF
ncbi:peptidylprolyl isomerase [Alteromonadaceae bacterium BrNp21-10]|nr:peptidylprolyl isomerase [Alteromonadaceae bacterium BrNp21-10]